MEGHTTNTVVDITRRLEWELSKEQLEMFNVGNPLHSPEFNVNVGNQVSIWTLGLAGNVDLHKAVIMLVLRSEDVSLKAEIEEMGIKMEHGYMAGSPFAYNEKSKMVSKIETFNGKDPFEEKQVVSYVNVDFNTIRTRITVVASMRIYLDRNDYIQKAERNENFMAQIGFISELDTLADFIVICEGREFKCHRNILASRSSVFKTMILNSRFVENRQNSVVIEKSSAEMVEAMLEFISKGSVPLDIAEKAIDLIALANRYDLQDLIKICESSLVNSLTAENVMETLIAIDLHVPNSQHRKEMLDFIKKEAANVVKSNHWKKFLEKYPDLVTEVFLCAAHPRGEDSNN